MILYFSSSFQASSASGNCFCCYAFSMIFTSCKPPKFLFKTINDKVFGQLSSSSTADLRAALQSISCHDQVFLHYCCPAFDFMLNLVPHCFMNRAKLTWLKVQDILLISNVHCSQYVDYPMAVALQIFKLSSYRLTTLTKESTVKLSCLILGECCL